MPNTSRTTPAPQAGLAQIERRVRSGMKADRVPALAIGVVRGGKLAYERGFGVRSVADGGAVDGETLFRIGSTTKPLTGTAIMRLVQMGELDLDRPISAYLPRLRLHIRGATGRITLRLLMSHRAGLPSNDKHHGDRSADAVARWARDELSRMPFVAPPGTIYSYSNIGVALAGHIAEVVTGTEYQTLMRQLVFEPLQMERTTFDPLVAMTYPVAQAHRTGPDGQVVVDHRVADNPSLYPAGFAFSNLRDMANFASLHMSEGAFNGRQLLKPALLREMHEPQDKSYVASGVSVALTWANRPRKGVQIVDHSGAISSYGSWFEVAVDRDVAVMVFTNRLTMRQLRIDQVADSLLDTFLDLPPGAPNVAPAEPDRRLWSRFDGTYLGDSTGLIEIYRDGDHLGMRLNGDALPLAPVRDDLYVVGDGSGPSDPLAVPSVGFPQTGSRKSEYVYLNLAVARRTRLPTVTGGVDLQRYSGRYNGDMEAIDVDVKDGSLVARAVGGMRDGLEARCLPLERDNRFASNLGVLEFDVDASPPVIRVGADGAAYTKSGM